MAQGCTASQWQRWGQGMVSNPRWGYPAAISSLLQAEESCLLWEYGLLVLSRISKDASLEASPPDHQGLAETELALQWSIGAYERNFKRSGRGCQIQNKSNFLLLRKSCNSGLK